MSRLHEIAPELFYGWADQIAKAKMIGGFSRRDGAVGALGGILKHYYGARIGDPDVWLPVVEAQVSDGIEKNPRRGGQRKAMTEDELAALYVAALVTYLTKMSDPKRSRRKRATHSA